MADGQQEKVLGTGSGMLTPTGYKDRPKVEINICDKHVTPAADSVIGTCTFYYQPLHGEYWETVEKVSMSSAWATVKKFATSWDPWKDKKVVHELLHRRENLIKPESTDSDWSRHGNFMMRHIGCGHKPPDYYVSYGYYYCSDYGANLYPHLTERGQAWLRNARWWLQKYIELGLQQNMKRGKISLVGLKQEYGDCQMTVPQFELEVENNGETFKTFAFKTHPLAYLNGGLANLPVRDLVKIGMRPNLQEWGDGRTRDQAVDAGVPVAKQKIRDWTAYVMENGADPDEQAGRALGRLLTK